MLLWNSPRRSGSCWMLLRGPCIGRWCRRTIVTSSQWVRKSSLSVTPSSLHFLSQLLEFVKSPIALNTSFVLGVKVDESILGTRKICVSPCTPLIQSKFAKPMWDLPCSAPKLHFLILQSCCIPSNLYCFLYLSINRLLCE